MNNLKSQSVSVIIPCYNEEDVIGPCLDALMRQESPPHEIILVDNNCTDNTVGVASRYPGVKIIREPHQGLIAARNAGFFEASGDIVARIDAESVVASDWVATVQRTFSDPSVQAVSGTGFFYDAPFKHFIRGFRNLVAVHLNRFIMGHNMLWGSNMALRRSAWQKIAGDSCFESGIMEDLDLAIHLTASFGGEAIAYCPSMRADISARRAVVGVRSNFFYLKMWPDMLKKHGYVRSPMLWPAVGFLVIVDIPYCALIRLYNVEQDRFIFSRQQWRSRPLYDREAP